MPDLLGYFLLNDDADRGVIALRDSLDRDALVETFAEEWAHARTAFLCDEEELDTDDPYHHPSFWAEYGRIVKAVRERPW
jgi:protein-tyrosine-phosphatase